MSLRSSLSLGTLSVMYITKPVPIGADKNLTCFGLRGNSFPVARFYPAEQELT